MTAIEMLDLFTGEPLAKQLGRQFSGKKRSDLLITATARERGFSIASNDSKLVTGAARLGLDVRAVGAGRGRFQFLQGIRTTLEAQGFKDTARFIEKLNPFVDD